MHKIIIICAYAFSAWTALCLLVDTLTIILSRDITSIGWYASNPLCLWKFPTFNLGAFSGILVWLVSIIITILVALFLV